MAQTAGEIRRLLEERGLRPKKSLGQNFLIDPNLVRKLVDDARVGERSLVLEVGPGTGVLTDALLESGAVVLACELDDALADLLRDRFAGEPRFELVHGDCLAGKRSLNTDLAARLGDRPFRLVANLPYQAATPLMLVLLTAYPGCVGQHVTIQREVADRLAASPGTKAYGAISVVAQLAGTVRRVANLPAECFWPRPGVESTMVALERRDGGGPSDLSEIAGFCQRLFAGRRKQLGAHLRAMGTVPLVWPEGIEPTARAESLSPEAIAGLFRACVAR